MEAWQPIETAPKDGTRILVWAGGKEPFISHFSVSERYEHGKLAHRYEGWFSPWPSIVSVEPTHWFPLPTVPEAQPSAAGYVGAVFAK